MYLKKYYNLSYAKVGWLCTTAAGTKAAGALA